MKIIRIPVTGLLIVAVVFIYSFLNLYAQTGPTEKPAATEQPAVGTAQQTKSSLPRPSAVKMAEFYLRDGKLVFGKLLSDEKNRITIEQLDENKIIVSTFSNKEIDGRTSHTKNMPESQYYIELAEYFSGRTWDFRDDPDDFMQALRCYEQARQCLAETYDPNSEKIAEVDERIKRLQQDKERWIKEITPRAELKKLEFEAEGEKRIKELENKLNLLGQKIDKSLADTKSDYQKLEKSISDTNKDIFQRLDILSERVDVNRRLIESIIYHHHWRWYPPYRIVVPEKPDSNQ